MSYVKQPDVASGSGLKQNPTGYRDKISNQPH